MGKRLHSVAALISLEASEVFRQFFMHQQTALFSVAIVFLASGCLCAQSEPESPGLAATTGSHSVNECQMASKSHQTDQESSSFLLPQSTVQANGKIQAVGFYHAHSDSGSGQLPDASSALRLLLVGVGLYALRRPSRKPLSS